MSVYDRIVSKSSEMFYEYGVSSVTTDTISFAAGISKRTFYRNFESKEELIKVIAMNEIDLAREKLASLSQRDLNPVVEAISFSELDLSYTRLHSINFLRDIKRNYPDVWTFYENFKTGYIQNFLQNNIRNGISQKYYWPDLNEELTALVWMELNQLPSGQVGADAAIRKHFIRGLLNQNGVAEFLFWQ